MTVPKNVLWFEVLLYASLLLDTLSAAFLDRAPGDLSEAAAATTNMLAVILLALLFLLIWLAARHRKNWARWTLVGAFGLSLISLADAFGDSGLQAGTFVDLISISLTAAGLYFAFTGDARDWFQSS